MSKKGQKKPSLAQFAWKLVENSCNDNVPNPAIALHLKSIFLSLDSDNDGLLTRPQLIDAIRLAGLNPRDALVKKYAIASSEAAKESAMFGSTATTLTQSEMFAQNVNKRKQAVVAPLFFKTDISTFAKITEAELLERNKDIELQIVELLQQFVEPGTTDLISVKHVRHILHETLAPTRLSVSETAEFLKSVELIAASSKIGTGESAMFVNIHELANRMLVGTIASTHRTD